ncbi:MAG TPA: hypothetical protein VG734_14030 [Lacunisphaera sp.]|nr:hypothetical protein [Lacunisphaera sp.]
MSSASSPAAKATRLDWTFRVLGFLLLALNAFSVPLVPKIELDSSWRMALGQFFVDGRQFGPEVMFTYGPLGWTMGKTYWGGQWAGLVGWHVVQALVFTAMTYWHGYRLSGYQRLFFFAFFFVFGLSYEDASHQAMTAFAGLELIRRSSGPWRWSSLGLIALLVALSLVKFTDMMLATFLVVLAGGLEAWSKRRAVAARVPAIFLGLLVLGWVLCGQNPLNLPAYVHGSWEISQGYQDAMGLPCPTSQLVCGLTVALLVVGCVVATLFTHADRVRGSVLAAGTAAYLYINWKHGYIRADGHQVGFYYAALTVIVTAPVMLEGDWTRLQWQRHAIRTVAGLVALVGLDLTLPGLGRGALATFEAEEYRNIAFFAGREGTRGFYDAKLRGEQGSVELAKTKELAGRAPVDVLGYEQAVAIVNGFNYRARPVFQSYSAYTPYLSHLNRDYYASDRAPEIVLFKLQSIDGRLASMDDADVLRLLVHRYTYKYTEMGYTVWQRKPGPFDAAAFAPKPIRSATVRLGQRIELADLASQNLWVEIEYHFSLLGRLRRFLFRPPLVQLHITDQDGVETIHRLPQPIGRTGFMLNPIIDDLVDYMRAAGGVPKRRVRSIAIDTAPEYQRFLQEDVRVTVSSLQPSDAGLSFFKEENRSKFHMFVDAPISYQALNPPNEEMIDNRRVMIMHAPSEMIFDVPSGATELRGAYGFNPGAYTDGGRTNGANFTILWSSGGEPVLLHERFLDPVAKLGDRGLQKFSVKLPKSTGQVYLRVGPGPYGQYAFDWTAWTGIEFK